MVNHIGGANHQKYFWTFFEWRKINKKPSPFRTKILKYILSNSVSIVYHHNCPLGTAWGIRLDEIQLNLSSSLVPRRRRRRSREEDDTASAARHLPSNRFSKSWLECSLYRAFLISGREYIETAVNDDT